MVGHQPLTGLSGQMIASGTGSLLVAASWATMLAALIGFTCLAMLLSVWSRNAAVGIAAPVVLGMVMQLVGASVASSRSARSCSPPRSRPGTASSPHPGSPVPSLEGCTHQRSAGAWSAWPPRSSSCAAATSPEADTMRRFIITVHRRRSRSSSAVGGAVMAGSDGGSSVTRARLERSLPRSSPTSTPPGPAPRAPPASRRPRCTPPPCATRAAPTSADVGPGSNWICLMSWTDPDVPMPPEGYGKFELNVHSNGCYTAAGPASSSAS